MAGQTMTPAMGAVFPGQVPIPGQQISAASVNSYRVAAVAERLATHFGSGQVNDPREFFNLCLSLARGIDYAVANNQVPETIRKIPLLLKKMCQHRNDLFLRAAIMVLMISVKNACKIGWFSGKETEELLTLANEIASSFCSPGDMNTEATQSLAIISTIMTRFYPLVKMGQILASLEVKPGYGAHVCDFNILKQTTHSPEEKIRLFVAQKDNLETSTCITSPQLVNFLLNGKPVDRRTNISMDPGPQMPTNVTSMLKYGTNLLQAVGQFNGHYIIVVAFTSVTPLPDTPVLQEYVQPAPTSLDSDSDIIEGPSRISLNCPISYKRIKTPVKGLTCKHLQCFDFSNYVDINTRRPSWRCPHCNQFVCYTDIRVDQNMVKVLKEVGGNVEDVIISANGSWKAVMETDGSVDKAQALNREQQERSSTANALLLDLSEDDDEMATADTNETEDVKPFPTNTPSQSAGPNLSVPPGLNISNGNNQNVGAQVEDDFWSDLYIASTARSDAEVAGAISQSFPANSSPAPLLTDGISRALNRESGAHGSANMSTSLPISQYSGPSNLQLQRPQLDSTVSNEYGRSPSIPRHITRTPIAIQALPAQPQVPNLQQRSRPSVNSPIPNSSRLPSQTTLPRLPIANDRQHLPRSNINAVQNLANQERPVTPGQSGQQVGLPSSSQLPGAYSGNSPSLTGFKNSHLQQAFNRMMPPQSMSHSPSSVRAPSPVLRPQIQQGGATPVNTLHAKSAVAAQRIAMQTTRQSPQTVPVQLQPSRTVPSSTNVDGFRVPAGEHRGNMGVAETISRPDEQNWRPTGRMRGSLQGSAYSAALSQFMMQPTQPTPPVARPSNLTSPIPTPPDISTVLVANSRSLPVRDPASTYGGSDTQPEQSQK